MYFVRLTLPYIPAEDEHGSILVMANALLGEVVGETVESLAATTSGLALAGSKGWARIATTVYIYL